MVPPTRGVEARGAWKYSSARYVWPMRALYARFPPAAHNGFSWSETTVSNFLTASICRSEAVALSCAGHLQRKTV